MKNLFYGTPQLMKFLFRKERIAMAIWLAVISVLCLFVAVAFGSVNAGTDMAALWDNPAVVAMLGPLFGEIGTNTIYAASMILTLVIIVAIMNIFFVIRNTRAEEEKSLGEVVRSLPVGRLANLAAVMAFAALTNIAIAVLLTIVLCGFYGFASAAVFGFAVAFGGFVFAGIAAVLANLSASNGSAIGMSIGAVLVFYMLRAIGDVSAEVLSFFSPIGLAARTQPMAENIVWPLFVLLALAAAFTAVAFYLNSIRDFGRGIFNAKAGRREGSFLMQTPAGVLFKLTRRGLLFWAIGLFMLGASYGVVMGETESFLEMIQGIMPNITDVRMFIVMITMISSVIAVIPALMAILRLGGEEKSGRYEQIFAGSVCKYRMMATHLAYAVTQAFVMTFVAMFGLWATSAAVMDNPISFGEMFGAFMVYLPASLVMIGLAALLVSVVPKRAGLITYSYIGLSFFVLYLGPMADLPKAASYITPFGFIPQIPVDTVNPWTLAALTAVAALLMTGSFFMYRRRDLKFAA